MSNLYFYICGFFCIALIIILFFAKEKVKNYETKIYGLMIVGSLVDIIICITLVLIAYYSYNDIGKTIIVILNKIDFIYYIWWPSLLFLYILYLIYKREQLAKYERIIVILNSIFILIEFFLPIELINENGSMGVVGVCPTFVYSIAVLYILFTAILIIFKVNKRTTRKYIPFIALLVFMVISLFIRALEPTLLIIPSMLVYIDMIMYFTIENPDVKMLEETEEAKRTAEKANRAKSDFLSSMSHEIRTPLNAIVGLSEDLGTYKDQLPREAQEDAEDIINASKTLLEIVGNILDISKIESEKMEINEVPYVFNDEIIPIIKMNLMKIEKRPVEFKYDIAEDIPYELVGDKAHIKQIVNNLLSNAIKYTNQGEINFNIKCINKDGNCELIMTVKDTGIGIKKEKIDKLFSKFDRLEVEKETTVEGTGLGLAITKKLVDLMNGTINVQSEYGKGSIFVVTLPQKVYNMEKKKENKTIGFERTLRLPKIDPNMNYETVKESPEISKYYGKRLLIADDNNLNLKVAKRALKDFNFTIVEAKDGKEVLEKINSGEKYDLILMDIMMPNMNGEEAFIELKKNPEFNTPTIALTADAVAGAQEHYKEIGFNDYLAKPFTREQIKEKLDKIFK